MLAPGEKAFRRILHITIALLLGITATLIAVEASSGIRHTETVAVEAN